MTSSDLRIINAAKRELEPQQAQQFMLLFQPKKKSVGVGVLLALFLGGLGAHHFYLGKTTTGVVYLLCGTVGWLLILPPIVIAIACIFDACTMGSTVKQHNEDAATQLIDELKLLSA